jgi:hypothetical protein
MIDIWQPIFPLSVSRNYSLYFMCKLYFYNFCKDVRDFWEFSEKFVSFYTRFSVQLRPLTTQ